MGHGPMRYVEGVALVFILEPLVVVGEAAVYAVFARLGALRSLLASFVADVASYLAGIMFWFAISLFALTGDLAGGEIRGVLVIVLTLLVEVPIVIRFSRGRATPGRLRAWALTANGISCAVVWIVVDRAQLR